MRRALRMAAAGLALWSVAVPAHAFGGLRQEEIVSAAEARAAQKERKGLIFMDARSVRNYEQGHIEGAILPLTRAFYREEELFRQGIIPKLPDRRATLEEATRSLDRARPIITYCSEKCNASAVLLYDLKRIGFTDVRAMEGGVQAWQAEGYPLTQEGKVTIEELRA